MLLALVQQEMAYGAVYAYLGISLLLIAGFVAVVMVLARLLSPSRQGSVDKRATYETSEKTVTDPWRPFPVRYYVFALTFLIFDVEALFLFPWAVVYGDLGLYGFVQMTIFVGILTVGLIYEWKKGALKWV
nr:NADH-quinone oxidoreductase subunit A [Rubrobacter aplysinae]